MEVKFTYSNFAKVFGVLALIQVLSMARSMGADFSILGMDAGMSIALVCVFPVTALLLATLFYKEVKFSGILAAVVGVIALVFGVCLMGQFIDNHSGYVGWILAVYAVGCFLGTYAGFRLAAESE